MHRTDMLMHMARATLNIDSALIDKAKRLIAKESARRLALLGGSEKGIKPVKRRRSIMQAMDLGSETQSGINRVKD